MRGRERKRRKGEETRAWGEGAGLELLLWWRSTAAEGWPRSGGLDAGDGADGVAVGVLGPSANGRCARTGRVEDGPLGVAGSRGGRGFMAGVRQRRGKLGRGARERASRGRGTAAVDRWI